MPTIVKPPTRWRNIYRHLKAPFTFRAFVTWLRAQDWLCAYCETTITHGTFTVDHETPRSLGGSNNLDNLRLACRRCNLSKGAMTGAEFEEILRVLALWKHDRSDAFLRRLRQGWRYFR